MVALSYCLGALAVPVSCAFGARIPHAARPARGEVERLVEYYGRFDFSVPGQATFDWPGCYIEAGSTGSTLGVNITGPAGTYFDVFIDGAKVPAINAPDGQPPAVDHGTFRLYDGVESYQIATGLPTAAHAVRLAKRSENTDAPVVFSGFLHGDGSPSKAPDRPALKIEFLGASTTAGYGVESPSKSDPGKQDESGRDCSNEERIAYTNTNLAYSAIAAHTLGAQYHVVAQSGLGMVRNYGGGTARPPYEEYYTRTLESQPTATWDFSSWIADVVVISVGRNDFSTPLGSNDEGIFVDRADLIAKYKMKYREFLNMLRAHYPGVQIINSVAYVWPDDEFRPAMLDIISMEVAEGATDLHYHDFEAPDGFGCHYHSDLADSDRHGREIAAMIEGILQLAGVKSP